MAGTGQGDDATWGPQQVQGGRQQPVPAVRATPAAPAATAIVTPAAAAYTPADITAMADVIISLRTTVNAMRGQLDDVVAANAQLRTALAARGITT